MADPNDDLHGAAPDRAATALLPPGARRRCARVGATRSAQVTLTHPDRVLFPAHGPDKAELQRYYAAVRAPLWAHLAGRPLSVLRAGGDGRAFFQRHGADAAPQLFVPVPRPDGAPYMRLRAAAAIDGLAQLGIVELHTWGTRARAPQRADRLVFDLDPDPALDWAAVRDAALRVRELLDELGLAARLKTSGGAGLHVVVPLAPAVPFELAAEFSARVARHLARSLPASFVATRGAGRRRGRVYVDWQRNQTSASTVAAWSPRWRAGAPVSMPLDWSELGATDLRFAHFDLHSAAARYARRGDPWLMTPLRGQRLAARALRRAGSLLR